MTTKDQWARKAWRRVLTRGEIVGYPTWLHSDVEIPVVHLVDFVVQSNLDLLPTPRPGRSEARALARRAIRALCAEIEPVTRGDPSLRDPSKTYTKRQLRKFRRHAWLVPKLERCRELARQPFVTSLAEERWAELLDKADIPGWIDGPVRVPCAELIERLDPVMGSARSGEVVVGRALRRLCPGARRRRVRIDGSLRYVYEIPSLEECDAALWSALD